MNNFIILNDKIITSKYVLDLTDYIEKAEDKSKAEKVLLNEFEKLILQGKVTFLYLYCDRYENQIRGRVRASAGFRHGTQRKDFIPNNLWPKTRSPNKTALRYYDFGRGNWRAFRKNMFVIATSFWDDSEKKWKDNPYDAGFTSDWNKIKDLNRLEDYVPVNRPLTAEELKKRAKVEKQEREKRERQIKKTQKKSSNIQKGKEAFIGELRTWKDGEHIKTKDGWEKQYNLDKKFELIKDIVNNLSKKYLIDTNRVHVKITGGGLVNADVGFALVEDSNGKFFKEGKRYSRGSDIIDLKISSSFLNNSNEEKIKRTITHEFAHILQHFWLTKDEIKQLKKQSGSEYNFTNYNDNMLEVQAEAFTIMELGFSNYSKQNSKDNKTYKQALENFWSISPFEKSEYKTQNKIKKSFAVTNGIIKIN